MDKIDKLEILVNNHAAVTAAFRILGESMGSTGEEFGVPDEEYIQLRRQLSNWREAIKDLIINMRHSARKSD